MAQVTSPGEVIRFGTFELDVSLGELRERGVRLSIQGLPLQILAILAGKPGTLVTRGSYAHVCGPLIPSSISITASAMRSRAYARPCTILPSIRDISKLCRAGAIDLSHK